MFYITEFFRFQPYISGEGEKGRRGEREGGRERRDRDRESLHLDQLQK